jgi:hypothetical protein
MQRPRAATTVFTTSPDLRNIILYPYIAVCDVNFCIFVCTIQKSQFFTISRALSRHQFFPIAINATRCAAPCIAAAAVSGHGKMFLDSPLSLFDPRPSQFKEIGQEWRGNKAAGREDNACMLLLDQHENSSRVSCYTNKINNAFCQNEGLSGNPARLMF